MLQAPLFVDRMQHLALVLEEKYKWKEWKYMFKLSSSKIVSALMVSCPAP